MPETWTALDVTSGTTIATTWGDGVRDSVITAHASYSALTSAITSPEEGMVSYLTDNDVFWYYKNSQWRMLPGQYIYAKRDTSTSFFTNQAAGSFLTAYTTSTITVPTGGAGQAFAIEWTHPASSGVITSGRYNTQLAIAVNGGSFNDFVKSDPKVVNAVDTYLMHGQELWKQGVTDLTCQLRIKVIAVGGNFDSIADSANPAILVMRTTGMLSSEVV